MEKVFIPETVEYIGENAFMGNDDMTAQVVGGSYAEQYCKDNGISYVTLDADCKHKNRSNEVTVYGTCTEGQVSATACNDCGKLFSKSRTVALGHTVVSGECERCGNTLKNKKSAYDRVVVFALPQVLSKVNNFFI